MSKPKLPLHDNQLIANDFTDNIDAFKSMMESCYCYGGLTKTNKYLVDFKKELGDLVWNEVYESHGSFLKNNYTVEHDVYKDYEGVTYNRLVPRLDNTNNDI